MMRGRGCILICGARGGLLLFTFQFALQLVGLDPV